MADLSRIHDFDSKTGQAIVGQDIDDEFDQLVARINDVDADSLAAALAEALGVSQAGSVRRGKSIVATEQSTSSTSFTTLATPDRVQQVVLPADGLLYVAYRARWKESVVGAARAAIFLGGTQIKAGGDNGQAPVSSAAACGSGVGDNYELLTTFPQGLFGLDSGSADHDETTGQALGAFATTRAAKVELAGSVYTFPETVGSVGVRGPVSGVCVLFAAAGTYDISVRFKASSGSVAAKNRSLRVWTQGF